MLNTYYSTHFQWIVHITVSTSYEVHVTIKTSCEVHIIVNTSYGVHVIKRQASFIAHVTVNIA